MCLAHRVAGVLRAPFPSTGGPDPPDDRISGSAAPVVRGSLRGPQDGARLTPQIRRIPREATGRTRPRAPDLEELAAGESATTCPDPVIAAGAPTVVGSFAVRRSGRDGRHPPVRSRAPMKRTRRTVASATKETSMSDSARLDELRAARPRRRRRRALGARSPMPPPARSSGGRRCRPSPTSMPRSRGPRRRSPRGRRSATRSGSPAAAGGRRDRRERRRTRPPAVARAGQAAERTERPVRARRVLGVAAHGRCDA